MEVHHHTHSSRKKWAHYFWEFLMLFLAVFCGFLAEYQLEHKIEKDRASQYIVSFYEDLKVDTARISLAEDYDDEKTTGLAKLRDCYNAISKNKSETACLLEIIKLTSFNRPFQISERTLTQLANAGGFRLLRKADADSIISYQKVYDNFQDFQATVYQEAQNNVRSSFNGLINFRSHAQMFTSTDTRKAGDFNSRDVTETVLFSGDSFLLNKYFNELQLYYRVMRAHQRRLGELKEHQVRLIEYFKHKYHFE